MISEKVEVIAINGGKSRDDTFEKIKYAKNLFPNLIIIDKGDNKEGYAVIKHGFYNATSDWVFYTDGDAQYHLDELVKLVRVRNKYNCDVVNGYKVCRSDNLLRRVTGKGYEILSRFLFKLPIRDLDCDFRLIRMKFLKGVIFESSSSSILLELILKLKNNGAVFKECPVSHYPRIYGHSNYTACGLMFEKLRDDFCVYRRFKSK